jgi:hypothetical protein
MTYTIPGWSTPDQPYNYQIDPGGGYWNGELPGPPASQTGPEVTSQQKSLLNPNITPFPGAETSYVPTYTTTAVDTDAMSLFASNIGQYIPALDEAIGVLQNLQPVAAGSFPSAYKINTEVNSQGELGAGVTATNQVDMYIGVLKQCKKGVSDLQTMMQEMAKKYTTVDERNNISATTLNNDMASVSNDFNNMMKANGGTGGSNTGSGDI